MFQSDVPTLRIGFDTLPASRQTILISVHTLPTISAC